MSEEQGAVRALEAKVEKLRAALFGVLGVGPDGLDNLERGVKMFSPADANVTVALAAIQALRETQSGA